MPRDLPPAPAFLGVERSLTGRRWEGPDAAARRSAERMAQVADLPPAVAATLARLGVPPEEAGAYLDPKLRDLLPDPRRLKDIGTAADRLSVAVEAGERIAIFADYDVDGGASAAELIWWLRELGREATLYVPDRLAEGYGPNTPAMAQLAQGHDLILCVDCGTMAHGALGAAAGTDVIVIDHHLAAETLPEVLAVVNPNRRDEPGDLGHLCAAAVTFLVIVETARRRREAGLAAPSAAPLLDLVALATVADVAPLRGVNRALVRAGLAQMGGARRPGLAALAEAARLTGPVSARHLGYVLGPRLNAGGRVGQADAGARLLATDDPREARALAAALEDTNRARRVLQEGILAEAEAQVAARGAEGPLVWAAAEGWHPGVLGIVAGRLARIFGRPAAAFGISGGVAKGSGRSVAGIDLGRSVHRIAEEGLLLTGGGHEMAAGLSAEAGRLEDAMARLAELLAKQGAHEAAPGALRCDGLLLPGGAGPDLCRALDRAGPYGEGAPAPVFALPDLTVAHARAVGADGAHLKLAVRSADGARLEAFAFGAATGPLGALLREPHARVHLAGTPELDVWQGRERVQLRLLDASPAL